MDKIAIGIKISAVRKERHLTQKQLAEKLHVSDKTVSKWETGTHFPDIAILDDLASALEISTVELLGLEDASSQQVLTEITSLSIEDRKAIIKEIRTRGLMTVIIGLLLWAALIYSSKVLADNGLFGLPQITTIGMSGFVGILIANGIASIYKGNQLLK